MSGQLTTWREMIREAMQEYHETVVVATTLTEEQYDKEFDRGFGGVEGCSFTLWTKDRVYFPIMYDGAEYVGSAPRNPCDEACEHQGG